MSGLLDALLGGIQAGGAYGADAMRGYANERLREEVETARREAVLQMQQQQLIWQHDKQEEWRKQEAEETMSAARDNAARRVGGLIDQGADRDALKEEGLTDWEIERRMNPKVTSRDVAEAQVQSGRMKAGELLAYDDKMEMLKEDRERRTRMDERQARLDEENRKHKDRQLDIMEERAKKGRAAGGGSSAKEDAEVAKVYASEAKDLLAGKVKPRDMLKMEPEEKAEAIAENKRIDEQVKIARNSAMLVSNQKLRTQVMNGLADEVETIEAMPRSDGLAAFKKLEARLITMYDRPLVNQMLAQFKPAADRIYRKNGGNPNDWRDARDRGAMNDPGALSRMYTGE